MPPPLQRPLDYASRTPIPRKRLTAKQWALRGVLAATALIVGRAIVFGPFTSAQVRLDTGDVRYCFYGMPIYYRRTPEPYRTTLLRVAATSSKLPAQWEAIQFGGNHNPDSMCQWGYVHAACWESADSTICRLATEDMADFARTRHWNWGLPKSSGVATWELIDQAPSGTLTVKPDWKKNESVQYYCRSKGYTFP